MTSIIYDKSFFDEINPTALKSAELIVPLLIQIVNPRRVVDVGCGTGAWLSIFKKFGVEEILGIDGDYISPDLLMIGRDEFISKDLERPIFLPKTYDLALCLEVAEHLHNHCARELIQSLIRMSPFIFFSAAIPGQCAPHHINLQWPDYWENLFKEKGYLALDPVRPLIWQDQRIAWYYQQNCFLFVEKSIVESNDQFKEWAEKKAQNELLLIRNQILAVNFSLTNSLKRIPGLAAAYISRIINK